MSDQAGSALTNLTPYAWILFTIAGILSAGLVAVGLLTFGAMLRDMAVIARGAVRRRKLTVAIAKVDEAQRPTRAMDLGGLVITPCGFCQDLGAVGNPDDCQCGVPCGRMWCTRLRDLARRAERRQA